MLTTNLRLISVLMANISSGEQPWSPSDLLGKETAAPEEPLLRSRRLPPTEDPRGRRSPCPHPHPPTPQFQSHRGEAERGGAGRGGQGAGPRWSSQPPASVRANPAPLIRRGRGTNCIAGTAHASAPGLCAEPQGRENQSHFQQSDVAGSPERDGTVPDSAVTPLTCFGACAPTPLRRPAHGQAAQSWGAGGQVSRRRRELRPGQLPPHREGARLRHRTPGLTSQPR